MSCLRKVREILGRLVLLALIGFSDIALIANPEKNFRIIMKDGKNLQEHALTRNTATIEQGGAHDRL